MIKKFGNEKGFSLAEVMIGMAMAGGLALVIMKITDMGTSAQKQLENKDEIHQIYQEIAGVLADRPSCTNTFLPLLKEHKEEKDWKEFKPLEIKEIRTKDNAVVFSLPHERSGVKLTSAQIKNFNDKTKTVELLLGFSYKKDKIALTRSKQIKMNLDIQGDLFQGCVSSSGLLSTDPKEACDYLLGLDIEGKSYFVDADCQFARAVCEKQKRAWDGTGCTFSHEEKMKIREESCLSLVGKLPDGDSYFDGTHCDLAKANCVSIGWEWDGKSCQAPESVKKEMQQLTEAIQKLMNTNQPQ